MGQETDGKMMLETILDGNRKGRLLKKFSLTGEG